MKKVKRWFFRHAEPLTYLAMFILLCVGTFRIGWVSSVCIGVAWWLILRQWDQLKKWRKRAWFEHMEHVGLEKALQESGYRVVSTCGICHQDVLDFDEHYKKVHSTNKEKR